MRHPAPLIAVLFLGLLVLFLVLRPQNPKPGPVAPPVPTPPPIALSLLAEMPDWSALNAYQHTISRSDFEKLLTEVFTTDDTWNQFITIRENFAEILTSSDPEELPFILNFATPEKTLPTPRHWQSTDTLPLPPEEKPLNGLHIAIDPGHIGGEWARMEERFFVRGHDRPVQEAILNLTVARLLKARLESAGFTVLLSKDNFEPVTLKRPEDFRAEAERLIPDFAAYPEHERTAARADALRKRMELLFYRNAEITARAEHINQDLAPDLTLCLHFNAVEWNERQDLVEDNRLLIFVHGNYLPSEVADDQQRLRLFQKLLAGTIDRELPVAEAVVDALAKATGLPPVQYGLKSGAIRVGPNPYVYARNLAANRLINGPVIFLEPYYMNNRIVYQRIQLGDYDGTKEIEGRPYPSIFREYADAVAAGLISVFPRAP